MEALPEFLIVALVALVVQYWLTRLAATGRIEHWRHGEPESIEWPRRFALHRWYDLTGQSGTGIVAYGTVYSSGRTTLAWCCGEVSSVTVYDSPEQIERIHGHGGYTDLVWLDAETPSHTRNGEPERASVGHITRTTR